MVVKVEKRNLVEPKINSWKTMEEIDNGLKKAREEYLSSKKKSKAATFILGKIDKAIENSEKERINNDGTIYIGEGLENYYKDQLERTGKFKVVAIDATRVEVLQVENKISIKEITELCNEYNRSDLKIYNLKRDLEYKKSWNEESFAIQEIKQQISILQKIKETAQSKLQEIGIVF